jgi:zinc transport system substrate-binding protein
MNRRLLVLLALVLVSTSSFSETLRVFASVLPVKTFVEKVGGKHVDVREMVRPGFNPHTYDPTPQQISALADTVLYVRTGVPFEKAWMKRILSANPDMQILDVRADLTLRTVTAHAHDEHEEHDHEAHDDHADEQDPHVWTNPMLVAKMIGRIRDKLSELDPENATQYAHNHDIFLAELKALDQELQKLLEPLSNRKFMVFHPAWGYFADRYHLVQVAIEHQGKEPGARRIASLIEHAKHQQIRVIFVQPQFDRRQARQVAGEIGGVVIAVDPLAANYVENLRRVGQEFAQVLKQVHQ